VSTRSALEEFEPPFLAADLPGDVSDVLLRMKAVNGARPRADSVEATLRPAAARQPYFEVFRAREVSLTTILFSGGDWRWRFCSGAGVPIATSAGYVSEDECTAAVAALRGAARDATGRIEGQR